MHLRSSLLFLVAATTLPLIVFSVVVSALLVSHDQENFVRAVKDRNRAFSSAVDAELNGHVESLQLLTALSSVQENDLAQVHRDLSSAAARQRKWIAIIFLSPDGQQLANTLVPYGMALPGANDLDSLRQSVATLQPTIGRVSRGSVSGMYGVPIHVPVVRDGKAAYVLSAVLNQEVFESLLKRQEIPAGWVAGITGPDGRLIARIPPREAGSLPAAQFLQAIATGPDGWTRMTTLEGIDNYTAHATSPTTHWTVSIAIPVTVVNGGIYRAAWILSIGVVATLVLGGALAVILGRRITRPIAQLSARAPLLGTPEAVQDPRTNIVEVTRLTEALKSASSAIQDRERLEKERRSIIEASDRSKDEFIAMLSHELRNPLAALSSAASVLKLSKPGTEAATNAQQILERQTQHMARLMDDLLEIGRIVAGKAAINVEPVELSGIVARVVQTWRESERLSSHDVSIAADVAWVMADRVRLEQIVSNLLDNAVKFTPPNKSIRIAVQSAEAEGRIVIADEGRGIASADMDRIFDLFAQGPQETSRKRSGMGVGLALVKRLAEMQGGKVFVQSGGLNKGATFTVALPACESRGDTGASATVSDSAVRKLIRILVVEDKEDVRASLVSLLTLLGCIVRQAAGGGEALKEMMAHPPDLALLDIGLPDIDGYEIARRVRKSSYGRSITLVAVTGYGQPEDIQRSLEAGFDFHLTKPVEVDDIKALFARIAERASEDKVVGSASSPAA